MSGSCGLSRFAWNWAVAICQRHYRIFGKKSGYRRITGYTLSNHWNKVKSRRFQWVSNYYSRIPRASFHLLEEAYKSAFARLKKGKTPGFPKFHKKGSKDSFQVLESSSDPAIKFRGNKVKIPKLGWVKFRGYLRWPNSKQLVARIVKRCDRWYLSLTFNITTISPIDCERPKCGVDLGCSKFATIASDGKVETIPSLKSYAKAKRKIQRLSRVSSRRFRKGQIQSKRHKKAKKRLYRLYERTANQRKNFLHQTTSKLTKTYGMIVLEDLNVAGMARGFLSGTILDMGFGEFRRQIEYKSEATGTKVIFADRFFPSSKTCCECGLVRESLSLSERTLTCPCGCVIDRDENAARNLEKLGRGSPEVTHGESGSSLPSRKTKQGAARRTVNAHSVSTTE